MKLTPDELFNRGTLMNIGFVEALKVSEDFDCFVFHDVDLLSEDDRYSIRTFFVISKAMLTLPGAPGLDGLLRDTPWVNGLKQGIWGVVGLLKGYRGYVLVTNR